MSKPRAIITKLEDCPPQLDRKLVKAYLETDYLLQSLNLKDKEVWLFRFDASFLWLEQALWKLDFQTFAILTAFNPHSVQLSQKQNLFRNAQLQNALLPHCRLLRDAVNQATGGDWKEPGFWALDIDLEMAVSIGQAFGQNALVGWKRGELPALWWL